MVWVVLLSALVGASAALAGQWLAHILSRRREGDAAARHLTAEMLAQGRAVQSFIKRGRQNNMLDQEGMDRSIVPFVRATYELKWLGPGEMKASADRFADEINEMANRWRDNVPGFLDQGVVDAANQLEATLTAYLSRPSAFQLAWRWLERFSRRNLPSSG